MKMQTPTENRPFVLGKNRIEALSDGIFAIVMTLLILELHVPDLPSNAANVQVGPALWHLWPKLCQVGKNGSMAVLDGHTP